MWTATTGTGWKISTTDLPSFDFTLRRREPARPQAGLVSAPDAPRAFARVKQDRLERSRVASLPSDSRKAVLITTSSGQKASGRYGRRRSAGRPSSAACSPGPELAAMLAGRSAEVNQIETAKAAICADDCCAPPPLTLPPRGAGQSHERQALIREAFRLEWLTVGWTVEAVVAIGAGVMAGSLVLMAFGLDSLIELASAGVLIWRLTVELRRGERFSEQAERIARRIAGALLLALAVYVTAAAAWSLWARTGEGFSWPGLIVALVAIPSMRYLAYRKITVAKKLGSRALRADAMEAVTCGWLSFVVVISLGAQWAFGAWWIDGVASLAIVWLLVKEGREAWAGRDCC
jgi:hypothetical protein